MGRFGSPGKDPFCSPTDVQCVCQQSLRLPINVLHDKEQVRNGTFMRTRPKQKCARFVGNATKRDTTPVNKMGHWGFLGSKKRFQEMVSIQNEIGTSYLHNLRPSRDKIGKHSRLHYDFLSARCPRTPQKRDVRLKNKTGMNFGNRLPPPLMCLG